MLKLLLYLMFFPIIIAFKLIGWVLNGIMKFLRFVCFIDIFNKM